MSSVARVTESSAESPTSFEDGIEVGVDRYPVGLKVVFVLE